MMRLIGLADRSPFSAAQQKGRPCAVWSPRRSARLLRLLPIAGVAVVGLVGLAACGDTTADDAAEAPDCAASPGETVTVDIGDFVFDPTPVRVDVCDSVTWTNVHTQAHTSTGQGDKAWSTGNLQPGETSEPVRFNEAGDLAYICALHPFMKGTVEVG